MTFLASLLILVENCFPPNPTQKKKSVCFFFVLLDDDFRAKWWRILQRQHFFRPSGHLCPFRRTGKSTQTVQKILSNQVTAALFFLSPQPRNVVAALCEASAHAWRRHKLSLPKGLEEKEKNDCGTNVLFLSPSARKKRPAEASCLLTSCMNHALTTARPDHRDDVIHWRDGVGEGGVGDVSTRSHHGTVLKSCCRLPLRAELYLARRDVY